MNPFRIFNPMIYTHASGVAVGRAFIANYEIPADKVPVQSDVAILAATPLTDVIQYLTEGITSPGTPRNIRILGNAAGIAGDVLITGTDFNGDQINETIALNGTTPVEGNKAFKTVTQIDLPVQTHAGTDTVSVGFGDKLGLPYKLERNTVLLAYLNDIKEATDPSVAVDPVLIENNTILLNTALNGSKVNVCLLV